MENKYKITLECINCHQIFDREGTERHLQYENLHEISAHRHPDGFDCPGEVTIEYLIPLPG